MVISVEEQFRGRTVLLTGGLGGVGSACLEALLKKTQVASVMLLVRPNKHQTAQQRVQKLLSGPLFHTLHKQMAAGGSNVFRKVHIVTGDLTEPGLGLSEADRSQLGQTNLILHSAADLALQAPIQRTLRANYLGTQQLLKLASSMKQLESFVFVSTYYVNNFRPFNDHVQEEVHKLPLHLAGDPTPLTHAQLVTQLMQMTSQEADQQAAATMQRLQFASTYAFGKLLTEQLVDDPATLPDVAKAIVRPSLVLAYAGSPYPGYCSGLQGAPQYLAGYGSGFFHDTSSIAFASDSIVDVIPTDVVSSLVVVAGAAAAAHGAYPGNGARVYHACSAHSHPFSSTLVFRVMHTFYSANPCPFRLPFARLPVLQGRHFPSDKSLALTKPALWLRVTLATTILRLLGQGRKARFLDNSHKTFNVQNTMGMCRSFISLVDNARELQASIAADEAADWTCVFERDSGMTWEQHGYTALAGLHYRLFKVPAASLKTPVPHGFAPQEGLANPFLMQQWMAGGTADAGSVG